MNAGIINVLKPPGMTSHDVVAVIRRIYGLKRVGHAGTLDPAASGVLPVFLGAATRLIEYTTDADKAYRAELTLGYSTDSGDDTGTIIEQVDLHTIPTEQAVSAVLAQFIGHSEQVPPMHSAIKVDGKRLYQLAREGIEIERRPRPVVITNICLVTLSGARMVFDVDCSKGTYIRTLCSDIGKKLGYPAVMSFLVRTRVGNFPLTAAVTLEEITANPNTVLLPVDYAIQHMPAVTIPAAEIATFRNGKTVHCLQELSDTLYRVYDDGGIFMGIATKTSVSRLQPSKVLG